MVAFTSQGKILYRQKFGFCDEQVGSKRGDCPTYEVNTFGAWRLAALGSGDSSRYTGDLSVRWEKAHGNRGLLRRVTGVSIQNVGWVRWLETLRAGGLG